MSRPRITRAHKHADKIEPRMERAMTLAMKRLQVKLPLSKLAAAIAEKDTRTAHRLIEELPIEDVLEPGGQILRDAFVKGGKTAAEDLNE